MVIALNPERCKIEGCERVGQGEWLEVHLVNTATDNYDRVNPVRVPVCHEHWLAAQPGRVSVSIR